MTAVDVAATAKMAAFAAQDNGADRGIALECTKRFKTLVEDGAGECIALHGIADRDDGHATLSGDTQPGRGRGIRGVLSAAHGDVLQSACGGGQAGLTCGIFWSEPERDSKMT